VGIDLDEVRRWVEASFGAGALDRPPAWQCRRRSFRRRCRHRTLDDAGRHRPCMPRAKQACEHARHETATRAEPHLNVAHLLLGLLDPNGNMAVQLIRHQQADPQLVRARVLAILVKPA
jgi:hypothetical protein